MHLTRRKQGNPDELKMVKPKGHDRLTKYKSKHNNSNHVEVKKDSKSKILFTFLTITCIGVAGWCSYRGYLETRVNTPFDQDKLVNFAKTDSRDRFWGSYRSNLYFGLKTRDPHSLVTGLMWYYPQLLRQGRNGIRHWCEQGDRLDRYGWLEHDGKTFGVQEIVDSEAIINTTFVKRPGGHNGGDWTARIGVTSENGHRDGEEISFVFYVAIEEKTNGRINAALGGDNILPGIEGDTESLGMFRVNISPTKGKVEKDSFLVTVAPGLHVLKEVVLQNLRLATQKGTTKQHIVLSGEQLSSTVDGMKLSPNFIATQVTAKIPFEFEVSYESSNFIDRSSKLTGKNFESALRKRRKQFDEKFEKTFNLAAKGYNTEEIKFAKAAFSNLLGGIGYFYGSSQVQSSYTRSPVPYWKAPLYTAVPSRSFFPRGFLWDEGFHGLLLSVWDLNIELDIIAHWFDLMNVEGWIPREMILGQEALAKVPEEFVTQLNINANPPTFFLTLHSILQHRSSELADRNRLFLEKLYPRLAAWFDWFNKTQIGDAPGTYRWRGRDPQTNKELNPKTLTSGLDDYPRASHPSVEERHVDLRCWIAFAAGTMFQLSQLLGKSGARYEYTFNHLTDNELLDQLHWSTNSQSYADYGLHTDRVTLRKLAPTPRPHVATQPELVREVLEEPTLRFVDSAFGYVSLFPFMLQIVQPDSPKLDKILDDIRNPDLLWTKYGLRSLAKSSPIYMKHNTEHDGPYWRGPIWMNLNYLTVRALHHYANVEGPYRSKAAEIYTQLRSNLIKNVFMQYKKSGFVWENYADTHGDGKGSHPFTGWTSLVVLLMAEIY